MEYRTDDEQIERLKGLWSKYGNYIIYSLIALMALTYGVRTWQNKQAAILEKSSTLFTRAMNSISSGNISEFQATSNKLLADYSNSIYADYTRLFLAKNAIKSKDFDLVEKYFLQVVNSGNQKSLSHIASFRLARVYYSQKEYDKALNIVKKLDSTEFAVFAHETRGDVHLANKQYKDASKEYEIALEKNDGKVPAVDMMIRHKLDSISAKKLFRPYISCYLT